MLYRIRCAFFELIANNGNGGYRLQFAAAQLPFDVRGVSSVEVCFPIIRVCILAPFHFGGVNGSCNSIVSPIKDEPRLLCAAMISLSFSSSSIISFSFLLSVSSARQFRRREIDFETHY